MDEFEDICGDVDPKEAAPLDKVRKNVWFSRQLIQDLEDIVKEDESNLTTVIRQGLKHYVRYRKAGGQ